MATYPLGGTASHLIDIEGHNIILKLSVLYRRLGSKSYVEGKASCGNEVAEFAELAPGQSEDHVVVEEGCWLGRVIECYVVSLVVIVGASRRSRCHDRSLKQHYFQKSRGYRTRLSSLVHSALLRPHLPS